MSTKSLFILLGSILPFSVAASCAESSAFSVGERTGSSGEAGAAGSVGLGGAATGGKGGGGSTRNEGGGEPGVDAPCEEGFERIDGDCTDIDECELNGGGCAPEAKCTNAPGSHSCTCNEGYVGGGETCEPRLQLVAPGVSSSFGDVALSRDGKILTFGSSSSSHVAGDTNGKQDVFAVELATKEVSRISTTATGAQANGDASRSAISADGNLVAFVSSATNLVASDTNDVEDVFVKDRTTGAIARVSMSSSSGEQANASCFSPSISADGRFVVFTSWATNIDTGCIDGKSHLFLHDRETKQTRCEPYLANGVISPDGHVLVGGSVSDVLAVARTGGAPSLISADPIGGQANDNSFPPMSLSKDARFVPFCSYAYDLVPNDTNGAQDVFLRDQETVTTTRVSVASDGSQGDDMSYNPFISEDGRFVIFESLATNLVPGDTNGQQDVFVHDRSKGTTKRISVGRNGGEANADCSVSGISHDGRVIAFTSTATNLVAEAYEGIGAFVYYQW